MLSNLLKQLNLNGIDYTAFWALTIMNQTEKII